MASVKYHRSNGTSETVEAPSGANLMETALRNGVSGIVGECGGQAMCATCHVYVRDEYVGLLATPSEDEEEMLEFTASERLGQRSRLGCQIRLGDKLDYVEVDLPEEQV